MFLLDGICFGSQSFLLHIVFPLHLTFLHNLDILISISRNEKQEKEEEGESNSMLEYRTEII